MSIKIKVGKEANKEEIKYSMGIKKSLDGNYMIIDNEEIDIVVMPGKMKVLALSKEIMDDKTYDTQTRFMRHLCRDGVVQLDSIHAGNVYGSLEAAIPQLSSADEDEERNSIDYVLKSIDKWIAEEKPYEIYSNEIEDRFVDDVTDPDRDETTAMGKVGGSDFKGTIDPDLIPFGVMRPLV